MSRSRRRRTAARAATLVGLVALGLATFDVRAQTETEVEAETQTESEADEDIGATATTVLGVAPSPLRAASDFHFDASAFRAVPRRTTEQLLTLAPGLVLANHGGIGHAPTVYLRGFDAGEGQDVAYDVDGTLINEPGNPHGHGYADVSFLPVEVVRSVEVREGPFDPRQPSYSVAGSIRYDLGVAERGLRLGVRYGSFRTTRALLVYAPNGEREGTFVAADLVQGDGFGPNRAHRSMRAVARIERTRGDVLWSLLAASHAQRFDSAGVIPEAAYRRASLPCAPDRDAQFFCWVDPRQGGAGQRHLVAGRVSVDRAGSSFEQLASLMFRSDRFRDDFTGIALSPLGDGLDQRYQALTAQLRGSYRLRGRFLDAPQSFELGYLARHDQGRTSMDRLRFADGIPRAQVFDTELGLTELAFHGQFDLQLSRWLTAQGGLRLEGFAAQLTHLGLPTSDRDGPRLASQTIDAMGFVASPRTTLTLHAHPTLDVVLGLGRGTRPIDAQALSDGERLPVTRVGAAELGLRHRYAGTHLALESRASAFATRVADDLMFDATAGRNVYVGETRRYGAMWVEKLSLDGKLDAQASFTWAEAHRSVVGSSPFALGSGPRLAYVPRFVARFDAAYHDHVRIREQRIGLSAGLGATLVGRKPLPNDQLSERIAVLDAGAELRYRFLGLELLVENLLDARYRAYELSTISDFSPTDGSPSGSLMPARLFAAGAPRTFFVMLSLHLDPQGFTESSR